ncbi:NAD-dependent epimerase/dehydratase family protein [Leptospira kirschneri]|uniref:NAD-dependent epimerase/dehydratase family protein n=1 Tax=Leptospira kirschneri TaxID=29507 RepID=UPI00398A6911
MKILIIGASGYLGGRIAQLLAKEFPSASLRLASSKIQNKSNYGNVEFSTIDWKSEESLLKLCAGIDLVIHAAGMNALDSTIDPVSSFEFNCIYTGRLLDSAVKSNVKSFIYFSTAHVYLGYLKGKVTENTQTTNLHPYAASHKAAEDLILYYNSLGKINGIVIRLSNSYGVPIDSNVNCWSLLVPDLCRQAVVDKKIVLRTHGLQRRDFIPISDVCKAVAFFIRMDSKAGGVFNLGGQWAPTVWEVAQLIRERCRYIFGYLPEIERMEPSRTDESFDLEYDISKILSLGFKLTENRIQEIDDLLSFCKSNSDS